MPIKATGGVYTSASATLLGSTSKAVSIYGNYRPDNIISSGLGMNIAGGVISASLAIDDTRITLSQKYEDSISTSGSLKVNLTKAEAGIEFSQTFHGKDGIDIVNYQYYTVNKNFLLLAGGWIGASSFIGNLIGNFVPT